MALSVTGYKTNEVLLVTGPYIAVLCLASSDYQNFPLSKKNESKPVLKSVSELTETSSVGSCLVPVSYSSSTEKLLLKSCSTLFDG